MTLQIDVATATDPFANQGMPTMSVERLPFTVKVVANDEQLHKAVGVRHLAYARHIPEFAEQLKEPEASDFDSGALVLVAESKLDGTAVGTMRIQTNDYAPLKLEESVCLPGWLQGCTLAEATRLGVTDGREGRLVKTALFKAYFLYCQQALIDWMVITARKPLDRQYDALLFKDAIDGGEFIPMRHVGDMPHRVMAFDVATAEERWIAARHPLYAFIFRTIHPDIQLSSDAVRVPSTSVLHGQLHSRNTMAAQL
jgi:hypothetical protein